HDDISDYLVSEKFDGGRAIWNGTQFFTRKGNVNNAPPWFSASLPIIWIDFELWTERAHFAALSGLVRTK
ncbi:DNA ligase, partial [Pseudoalteromonas sp. S186]